MKVLERTKIAVAYDGSPQNNTGFKDMHQVKVFELDDNGISELEVRKLPEPSDFCEFDDGRCPGRNEGYLNAVADVLSDCKFLLLKEIGGYPSRVFLRRGIETLEQEGEIESLLQRIHKYLKVK